MPSSTPSPTSPVLSPLTQPAQLSKDSSSTETGHPQSIDAPSPTADSDTFGKLSKGKQSIVQHLQHARRPSSIQFSLADSEKTLRNGSTRSLPSINNRSSRRISSPPPPTPYHARVSFDTFNNRDTPDWSFTLNYTHKDYVPTRRSRTWLCGNDKNDYSEFALEWLIDELVDDGDQIVCLRVVEKDSKIATIENASSDKARYRREAKDLLDLVIEKNAEEEKAISIAMELAVGKIQSVITRMIEIYEPSALIVGTRGRNLGGLQGLLPGSVSKWCLQSSPIPVIVVRPTSSREKKKQKRAKDPSRKVYQAIVKESVGSSGQLLDKGNLNQMVGAASPALDDEAAAVAAEIGLPMQYRESDQYNGGFDAAKIGSKLTKVRSGVSEATSTGDSPSPDGPLVDPFEASIAAGAKTPDLEPLGSPIGSEAGDDYIGDGVLQEGKVMIDTQPGQAPGEAVPNSDEEVEVEKTEVDKETIQSAEPKEEDASKEEPKPGMIEPETKVEEPKEGEPEGEKEVVEPK
ncbi:MAG: hypothetical protein M1834_006634 [Cirrosporium novae-zelandiae]|nr:MAG: hypothetical protein M1834_006634 [Cirrosporium novae-zelandiae]